MNAIARTTRTARRTGLSLTEVMLILAAVAAVLAVFFPTVEYFTLYRGSVKAHKFDPSESSAPARTMAPGLTPAPAPAAAPAAAPKAEPPATPEAPATAPATTPEAPKTAPTPAP